MGKMIFLYALFAGMIWRTVYSGFETIGIILTIFVGLVCILYTWLVLHDKYGKKTAPHKDVVQKSPVRPAAPAKADAGKQENPAPVKANAEKQENPTPAKADAGKQENPTPAKADAGKQENPAPAKAANSYRPRYTSFDPIIKYQNVVERDGFTIKDGILTDYKGNQSHVVIPDGVHTIGRRAFVRFVTETTSGGSVKPSMMWSMEDEYMTGGWVDSSQTTTRHENRMLCSVVIPAGVKIIAEEAFSGCENLQSVTLPEGLEVIGSNAFYNCKSLMNIRIPEGTKVRLTAFVNCPAGRSVQTRD